jgi:hypothetical protein
MPTNLNGTNGTAVQAPAREHINWMEVTLHALGVSEFPRNGAFRRPEALRCYKRAAAANCVTRGVRVPLIFI